MPKLAIAAKLAEDMKSASWIREMFEKGLRLKAEFGDENVQDFSLGNPNAAPPPAFFAALNAVAAEENPALHRYMPNAGIPAARAAVAKFLADAYGCDFDTDGLILTTGAAGATNVVMRAILDPGDEVIVLAPFFPEYRFYIEQANGRMVLAQTTTDFQLDLDAIAAAITDKTRAVLINSPNNPTGAVYPDAALQNLAALLTSRSSAGQPIYLVCDDVYHRVVFDVDACPTAVMHYPHAIVVSSYSKDLSVAGERLGYIALHTGLPERPQVLAAMTMLNRTLGFVNAPALMQRIIMRCADALCDIDGYRQNRDLLCTALRDYGYDLPVPGGALFAFPKTPLADDARFINVLLEHKILAVPGRGFGRPGHMRLSYCVSRETIERALPGFKAAIEAVQ